MRVGVLVCTPTPTRWVLITSLRVTRFCEAGSYLTQKERKFNFYFIVHSRVVGDANPYKVGAYYELASNKVLRSRFLFNAKREEI